MSIETPVQPAPAPPASRAPQRGPDAQSWRGPSRYFADYFWFILKNVIGWIFILAAPVLGVTLPGPGGIPVFLIGFALVTFPGKRKLTSRVMRGRRMQLEARVYAIIAGFWAILIPAVLWWIVATKYEETIK